MGIESGHDGVEGTFRCFRRAHLAAFSLDFIEGPDSGLDQLGFVGGMHVVVAYPLERIGEMLELLAAAAVGLGHLAKAGFEALILGARFNRAFEADIETAKHPGHGRIATTGQDAGENHKKDGGG